MIELVKRPGFNVWRTQSDTLFTQTECFHHQLSYLLFNLMDITNRSPQTEKIAANRKTILISLEKQREMITRKSF